MNQPSEQSNQPFGQSQDSVLMARQPIFNSKMEVCAYELLFRSEQDQSQALFIDAEGATSSVILNAFTAIWDQHEAKGLPVFINLSEDFILKRHMPDLPKDRVVLEVLEDVQVSPALLEAVNELKQQGYTLALDDFTYQVELEPLIELASIIKIDVRLRGMEGVREQIAQLSHHRKKLLAEKVETQEELDECRELGCEMFQGFFLSRPLLVRGKRMPTSAAMMMKVLQDLRSDKPVSQIEADILKDPALTYKLLKLINSAQFALRRRVTSVAEAVNLLGREPLQKWIMMLLAVGAEAVMPERIYLAMQRARMCEVLAQQGNYPNSHQAFMVGILASLEMLYGVPLSTVLDDLPLDESLVEAVHGRGNLGLLLLLSRAYERGEWRLVERLGRPPLQPGQAYFDSLAWATEVTVSMTDKSKRRR
ncbi:EAL and HDOD domain-containing protein [Balneatrix alpica]|uniref:EAL and HDOD domain-containing protein n=1 Tax=Balneatrix alpica TaxID=75684 RepID=UPI0027391A1A|nr:HDOD domain-containing protein [Balneatrix alpica]